MFFCKHKQCRDCFIREIPVFQGLDCHFIEELLSFTFPKHFSKKQIVALEGNPSQELYIARQGLFKAYKTLNNGKQQIVRVFRRGDFMQLTSYHESFYNETVETVTEAETCTINKRSFASFMSRHPQVALKLVPMLTAELAVANRTILDLGQKQARARVAGFILSVMDSPQNGTKPVTIELTLSRCEVANLIGTTQETIIRILSDFKKKKIIEIGTNKIILKNIDMLQRIAK